MLRLNNISKTFNPGTVNEKTALSGLSLDVHDGDFITIIGANGVAVNNVPAGEVWGGVPAHKIGENIHPLSPDSASI